MKTIDIMSYPYPSLIIPCASGITIEQQTGGPACSHHKVEGLWLPMPVTGHNLPLFTEALQVLHPGCYGHSLTFEEACKLDSNVIKRYSIPLEVDKEKLEESTEAWVYVWIMGKDDRWLYAPDSSTIYNYKQFARAIQPDITEDEVVQIIQRNILEYPALADFAGQEAILTWENCD